MEGVCEVKANLNSVLAKQHHGGNGGADGGRVKWLNMTPGAKKASAAQRIGMGRPK